MKVRVICKKCGFQHTFNVDNKKELERLKKIDCLCGGKTEILWTNGDFTE